MERKILDAGKKAAEDLAPDPIKHTPEAPIISEEEAQVIESPSGSGQESHEDEQLPNDIRRRHADYDNKADSGGIRITPED
jgi:hypothetical protein